MSGTNSWLWSNQIVSPVSARNALGLQAVYGMSAYDYGVVADGVTDDTVFLNNWISAVIAVGGVGIWPAATIYVTSQITIDVALAKNTGAKFVGGALNASVLKFATNVASPNLLVKCSTGGAFYFAMENIAIHGSVAGPLVQIGQTGFTDAFNSCTFKLDISNSNPTSSAIGLVLNYVCNSDIFGVSNCAGLGTSLKCNQVQFSRVFGSFSNANIGVQLTSGFNYGNTFLAIDAEVVNICVQIDNAQSTKNNFIGGQYSSANGATPVACINGTAGSENRFVGINYAPGTGATITGTTGVILHGSPPSGTETLGGLVVGNTTTANGVSISGATAGSDVVVQAAGVDANVSLDLISKGTNSVKLQSNGIASVFATSTGALIGNTGQSIGFYGASRITKQTISGSKGANAALASLLTALATLGLITDSTT